MVDISGQCYSRVLLVSPSGPSGLSFALHPIPLGLECIAAMIRDDVKAILIYNQFLDKEPFSTTLSTFKPDLVAFSMSATEHNSGGRLMEQVRKYNPGIPIIAGGFHPTGAPEVVLKELECDAVCRGEGEMVFKDIVLGKPWKDIEGLSGSRQAACSDASSLYRACQVKRSTGSRSDSIMHIQLKPLSRRHWNVMENKQQCSCSPPGHKSSPA